MYFFSFLFLIDSRLLTFARSSNWAVVVLEERNRAERKKATKNSGNTAKAFFIECYFVCRRFKWAKNRANFLFVLMERDQSNRMDFLSSFVGIHSRASNLSKKHFTIDPSVECFYFNHLEMLSWVSKHFSTALCAFTSHKYIHSSWMQIFVNFLHWCKSKNICYTWETWKFVGYRVYCVHRKYH